MDEKCVLGGLGEQEAFGPPHPFCAFPPSPLPSGVRLSFLCQDTRQAHTRHGYNLREGVALMRIQPAASDENLSVSTGVSRPANGQGAHVKTHLSANRWHRYRSQKTHTQKERRGILAQAKHTHLFDGPEGSNQRPSIVGVDILRAVGVQQDASQPVPNQLGYAFGGNGDPIH